MIAPCKFNRKDICKYNRNPNFKYKIKYSLRKEPKTYCSPFVVLGILLVDARLAAYILTRCCDDRRRRAAAAADDDDDDDDDLECSDLTVRKWRISSHRPTLPWRKIACHPQRCFFTFAPFLPKRAGITSHTNPEHLLELVFEKPNLQRQMIRLSTRVRP